MCLVTPFRRGVGHTHGVDAVDRTLVEALQRDGRTPFAELGRLVGLSGPGAQERVRRLEDRGVVTGFRAVVDPAAIGLGVRALVGVYTSDAAEVDDVARRLRQVPAIADCWYVAGDEEFVVTVQAADIPSLERTVAEIRRLRGVARTRTTVVLSARWEGRPVPAPET